MPEVIAYGDIADSCWSRLQAAADDRAHPMRLIALATLDRTGRPDVRLMNLRGASRRLGFLWFHCDVRTAKVAQLRASPGIGGVAYDPADGVQLRLHGTAAIHTADEVALQHWEQLDMAARYAYRTAYPPGARLPVRDPRFELLEARLRIGADLDGHENFAVIAMEIESIHWLQVGAAEQRSARLRRAPMWDVEPLAP